MKRAVLLFSLAGCASSASEIEIDPHRPHHHGHLPAEGKRYAHDTCHHSFEGAEQWAEHFEGPGRDAWQKPDEVIAALALEPGMVVADIGSATGYFPVRLAAKVPEGRVWGVDIEPEMVRYLNARARREQLPNLFSVLGQPDDAMLPEPVDRVLLVNTVHHIAERPAYFARLAKHLRREGLLVIVDFKLGELPVGPPEHTKLAPEQVTAELAEAGFFLRRRLDLPYQYLLVFAPL